MTARRRTNTRWRLLAHHVDAAGAIGATVDIRSELNGPSVFDEVVVDHWLHVEEMDAGRYWMNVGGLVIWVTVTRDGRPTRVYVDDSDLLPGVDYTGAVDRRPQP